LDNIKTQLQNSAFVLQMHCLSIVYCRHVYCS